MKGDKDLSILLHEHVLKGSFKLSHGRNSEWLIDLAKFLRTREGIKALEDTCWPDWSYDCIGGPLSAADLMCPALGVDEWFGVRKKAKGRGTDQGRITGNFLECSRVVLVEDVCTSGATLIDAAEEVLKYGAEIVGAVILVDRIEHMGAAKFKALYRVPVFTICVFDELLFKE